MDILKKVELLINATTRAKLPRRARHTILDEQEEQLLAEIRQAVANVQAQERVLAEKLKVEKSQARAAAERGDMADRQIHQRRAIELEHQLEQESIQAIDLEEKLAALEEKLALAKAAVEKEAQKAAERDAEAERVLTEEVPPHDSRTEAILKTPKQEEPPEDSIDIDVRKSRLSD
jgi:hypothetical protein